MMSPLATVTACPGTAPAPPPGLAVTVYSALLVDTPPENSISQLDTMLSPEGCVTLKFCAVVCRTAVAELLLGVMSVTPSVDNSTLVVVRLADSMM